MQARILVVYFLVRKTRLDKDLETGQNRCILDPLQECSIECRMIVLYPPSVVETPTLTRLSDCAREVAIQISKRHYVTPHPEVPARGRACSSFKRSSDSNDNVNFKVII